jgi:ATP-binding cassette, subfamily B, bacterial
VTPTPAPVPTREIVFERVCFSYGDAARPVLDRLDLVLPVGTSTAIVGLNGAGKTTLVKLLAGLYEPTDGRLRCDGVDLARCDAASWQRRVAVTFQDFVRTELTVRENVALGAIDHVSDAVGILAVLDRVGMRGFAENLPGGIDTPLSRHAVGGTDLSGGQWQRLALARSLFAVRHGASILILDEPTAHLDARGEAEFYETFLDLTRGVTSVIASHRFSSVRRADQIAVLQSGRVTEQGSHDDLVATENAYARMFAVQARRFAESRGAR